MKIGIFGGSFNPVHLGHYAIVSQLLAIGKVDKVIVIPSYQNPLKKETPVTPVKIRLQMLEETFQGDKNVEILDYEVKREELSYTWKTLSYLKQKYPHDQLYLVMGEDAYEQFESWRSPDEIIKLAHLMVFYRPAQCRKSGTYKDGKYINQTEWIEVTIPDISATEIRNVAENKIKNRERIHPNAIKTWEKFKKDE